MSRVFPLVLTLALAASSGIVPMPSDPRLPPDGNRARRDGGPPEPLSRQPSERGPEPRPLLNRKNEAQRRRRRAQRVAKNGGAP
jgi:hypothetical protein